MVDEPTKSIAEAAPKAAEPNKWRPFIGRHRHRIGITMVVGRTLIAQRISPQSASR
jgi:hypothetical protein